MFSAVSVCLSVCHFVCLLTMMKLGIWVHCTKILQEFQCQGQSSRSSGTKNESVWHFVWESSSGVRSSCGIFSGVVLRGAAHHTSGKISGCCLVYILRLPSTACFTSSYITCEAISATDQFVETTCNFVL